MPHLVLYQLPTDIEDGKIPLFAIDVPPFDLLTGIPAILSAISNLPKEARSKKPRSDRGRNHKKPARDLKLTPEQEKA